MSLRLLTGSLTRPMPQYAQASGKGIYAFETDTNGASFKELFADAQFDDVIWIASSRDGNFLYATHEVADSDQSFVGAFHWDAEKDKLSHLGSQPTGGNEACHASLSTDERFLLVANYNGEIFQGLPDQSLTVFPKQSDGSLGEATGSIRHEGSGPRSDRQANPHAHCVISRPHSSDIYMADLGLDLVAVYELSQEGGLKRKSDLDVRTQPGDGPRHIVFSPDGDRMFVVCELNPKVLSYSIDKDTGVARLEDQFDIPLAGKAEAQPSGIIMPSSATCLFVALRGCDELLGLTINPDGRLNESGRWSCGGRTPRDITFAGSDNQLLVANQDSSNISLFDVDPRNGRVIGLVNTTPIGTPMCMAIAPNPSVTQSESHLSGNLK